METKLWNDILLMKTPQGQYLGYHARTLDVATVSEEVWQSTEPSSNRDEEAFEQLTAWSKEEQSIARQETHSPQTTSLTKMTVNVTQLCNLQCLYCAAGGDGTYGNATKKISIEKTIPQMNFLLAKVRPGDNFQITYLGGEPLLYPEGIRLISEHVNRLATEKNFTATHRVVTNGTLLNRKNWELLSDIRAHLVVSFDGPPLINDVTRPSPSGKSSSLAITNSFELLSQYRNELSSFKIASIFGRHNLDIKATWDYFSKFSPDSFEIDFDHNETDITIANRYVESLKQFAEYMYLTGGEELLRKVNVFNRIFSSLDCKTKNMTYCGAGSSYLAVDANNFVFSCVWHPSDQSRAIGKDTVLNEKKLAMFALPQVNKLGCKSCWARYICGGGCSYMHEKSKHPSMLSELFCLKTKSLISMIFPYYLRLRGCE